MRLFEASFPVDPVPWQRVTPFKNSGRMITAEKTREYQRTLATLARYKMGPMTPFDQPLRVELGFVILRPEKFRRRALCDVKPDLDNLTKSVLDALNKIVWVDDCRIVELTVRKRWSGGRGCVFLSVYPAEET